MEFDKKLVKHVQRDLQGDRLVLAYRSECLDTVGLA